MHLEPPPRAPTCPHCGTNERVQRDRMGGTRKGDQGQRRWLCGTCWTVFDGGQHEWESTRKTREQHRARHQPDDPERRPECPG